MAEHELKPCPFCGSENINDTTLTEVMVCPDCATSGPDCDTPKEAVKNWNARPLEDAQAARIKDLEGTINEVRAMLLCSLMDSGDPEEYMRSANHILTQALEGKGDE